MKEKALFKKTTFLRHSNTDDRLASLCSPCGGEGGHESYSYLVCVSDRGFDWSKKHDNMSFKAILRCCYSVETPHPALSSQTGCKIFMRSSPLIYDLRFVQVVILPEISTF